MLKIPELTPDEAKETERFFFDLSYSLSISRHCRAKRQLELVSAVRQLRNYRLRIEHDLAKTDELLSPELYEAMWLIKILLRTPKEVRKVFVLNFDSLIHEADMTVEELQPIPSELRQGHSAELDRVTVTALLAEIDEFALKEHENAVSTMAIASRFTRCRSGELRHLYQSLLTFESLDRLAKRPAKVTT